MRNTLLPLVIVSFVSVWSFSAWADGPSLPPEDESGGLTRAQAVEVFARDCRATLPATYWDMGEEKRGPECLALDIDQNCNPDTFGCYGDYEGCKVKCQPKCGRCQDECADTCDSCKAGCAAGDAACIKRCAEGRADCRGRCMKGLKICQNTDCATASNACMRKNVQRLKECDAGACDTWVSCIEDEKNWEKADTVCKSKLDVLGNFCGRVCSMEHAIPTWYFEENFSDEAPVDDASALAMKCTAQSQCPADYEHVLPYLTSFCTGVTSDESFAVLSRELGRGLISKRTLSLVFNAYGAMHGYEFKKEKWMNAFFYGAGGAWLPDVCRARIRAYGSAKQMPLRYTKLRDRFKKVWNELK